ncbi:MAG: hAT transposon family protein [Sedimenticola sp.]
MVDQLQSLPPTSVSCEASFSHMKLIKTSRRMNLRGSTLNSLLHLKLVSPPITEFNPEEAIDSWLVSR